MLRASSALGVLVCVLVARANAGSTAPNVAASAAPAPAPSASTLPVGEAPAPPAKPAFSLNGHIVSEFAGNVTGGIPLGGTAVDRGTALSTEVGVGFDADLGRLTNSGAGIVHGLVTTRFGSNLSSSAIGNMISVQEIYGDGQTTRITFLDYEQLLFDKKLSIEAGKINQQNDFIAGSTYWGGNLYCFYQNNNICGTPAGIPNDNGALPNGSEGYTYYPSSEWGARLRANLTRDLYVQGAAIQGNPIVNNANGGLYLGFNGGTGTELPAEIGLTLRDRAGSPIGNVRAGGYFDTSNVQDFATRGIGAITLGPNEASQAGLASNAAALASIVTRYARGRSGAYVQVDHLLAGSSNPGATGTAIFGSFEYADPQTSLIGTMYDIGVVRHGTFRGRERDTIAAGFASDDYNVRLQRLERTLQSEGYAVPNTTQDQVVELTYGYAATSWFTLRPGMQLVIDPGGVKANPGAGVVNPPRNALVIDLGGYFTL